MTTTDLPLSAVAARELAAALHAAEIRISPRAADDLVQLGPAHGEEVIVFGDLLRQAAGFKEPVGFEYSALTHPSRLEDLAAWLGDAVTALTGRPLTVSQDPACSHCGRPAGYVLGSVDPGHARLLARILDD